LGAYMVLILSALSVLYIKTKKKRLLLGIFIVAAIFTLIFSYSRSAWIGALISILAIMWMILKNGRLKRILLIGFAVLLLVGAVTASALRHNTTFENVFFHTQANSSIKSTSDQGHAAAFKSGLHDVVHEPLGQGTGTAGPASVYNNNKARFSENYYLQTGQEVGIMGMAIFIAINALVGLELWNKREDLLAQILLASLIGITFINILSHAWTDDTLAYIWWGLAGIALAPILTVRQKAHGKKHQAKS
jgi:O-antigen ligase